MKSYVAKNLAVVSADQGGFLGTIVLEDHHMNVNNSVHGGMLGYLIDIAGGFAVISQTGSSQTGVSTDISYTMLSRKFETKIYKKLHLKEKH
jgi:acyl-coenzyme A thioesterase 13